MMECFFVGCRFSLFLSLSKSDYPLLRLELIKLYDESDPVAVALIDGGALELYRRKGETFSEIDLKKIAPIFAILASKLNVDLDDEYALAFLFEFVCIMRFEIFKNICSGKVDINFIHERIFKAERVCLGLPE